MSWGVAATGPAAAIGPATTGGAVGASGAGACATGGGESNACTWTGALAPTEGAVGGASGSAGDIGAGGTAPAAAESGAPVCRPLSKLCINSPGVRPWAGLAGASGAPDRGVAAAAGRPELGPPTSDAPGVDVPLGNDVVADGVGPATAAGPAGAGEGVLKADVKLMRDPATAGATWPPADGGGVSSGVLKLGAAPVAEPVTVGGICPPADGGGVSGGVLKPGLAPICDPWLLRTRLTRSSRFFWSSGCRNI